METTLAAIIMGGIVTFLTQKAKELNIPSRLFIGVLVIVISGFYAGFKLYLPEDIQKSILDFGAITFGSSVFLFEYVWRFFDKEAKK